MKRKGSMHSSNESHLDEAPNVIMLRGKPKFKLSAHRMTRVMCPMATKVECKFRSLVDKESRGLFDEQFDHSMIK
jgi:hypothetical protein